ncbi:hypothetical protein [Pantoea sp. Cy-639]|jgi:hypothetical protein|uniref:hypothetical protein n=1 Tax=Pantoea sp. Cy-639 TaxID=2608360 RepID=UPI00142083BF|nr:hypothetical protein [Pantoea sp. Cy-639]NIF16127.1 hypothetical protein [Pantoea sp. Cy-639]
MNLSWFGDWRFDLRRQAAFHETQCFQAAKALDYRGALALAARQMTNPLVDWRFVTRRVVPVSVSPFHQGLQP